MDSFFGIGGPELIVILIIAGIVMGPERIAKVARWLGQFTAQLQAISRGFAMQLKHELDAIDDSGELSSTLQDVRDLQREVAELRQELTNTTTGAIQEGREAVDESREMLNNSIRPPSFSVPPEEQPADAPADNGAPNGPVEEAPDVKPPRLPKPIDVPDDPE